MKVCDICGESAATLLEIKDIYKVKDMNEICLKCDVIFKDKDAKLWDVVLKIKTFWLRRAMQVTRNRLRGEIK